MQSCNQNAWQESNTVTQLSEMLTWSGYLWHAGTVTGLGLAIGIPLYWRSFLGYMSISIMGANTVNAMPVELISNQN